jgi:hypothetical protein
MPMAAMAVADHLAGDNVESGITMLFRIECNRESAVPARQDATGAQDACDRALVLGSSRLE